MISTQCIECKYYRFQIKCDAFPDRIPQEIFDGEILHNKKYKTQNNNITYEPIDTGNKKGG